MKDITFIRASVYETLYLKGLPTSDRTLKHDRMKMVHNNRYFFIRHKEAILEISNEKLA